MTVTVQDVRIVTLDGSSVLYVTGDDGSVYKGALRDDETLILIRVGDRVSFKVTPTAHERILAIVSWSEAPLDDGEE